MGVISKAAAWLGMSATLVVTTDGVALPPTRTVAGLDPAAAVRMGAVFRALQILSTAASQLSMDATRAGVEIPRPRIIDQPDLTMSRSALYGSLVVSMAGWGNALLEHITNPNGKVTSVRYIPPTSWSVGRDPNTGRRLYHVAAWDGMPARTLTAQQVSHLGFLRIPGADTHLGPLDVGRTAGGLLAGAADVEDYANNWFNLSGLPAGVLTTDQAVTPDQAKEALTIWEEVPAGRTRLAGRGLKYQAHVIDPAAAQWIEARRFNKTEIADLFGIPGSLMLGADQGTSKTYANVEQDWIGFVRFTLMAYLCEIEDALSALLPAGTTARFNVEALLRTDTKTRYEAYKIALDGGWMDAEEIRGLERMPPRATPAPTPTGSAA